MIFAFVLDTIFESLENPMMLYIVGRYWRHKKWKLARRKLGFLKNLTIPIYMSSSVLVSLGEGKSR